ncbi:hypothetical protein NMY22_g9753 [Coprinellus aureogranulatus]|nr:hypothetical protein NMY22_g9753 [Coprinellus aureogranulatus]
MARDGSTRNFSQRAGPYLGKKTKTTCQGECGALAAEAALGHQTAIDIVGLVCGGCHTGHFFRQHAHRRVPLLDFPLEILLDILEGACQDDGTTGMSLSSMSRQLRLYWRPYRYQSVQVNGWRKLLRFEEHFSQLPKEEQRICNLFVGLEDVFEVGYPGMPVWAENDPDDTSYVPSDDGLVRLYDSEGSDVEEEWDSEDEIEYSSPTPSEQLELEEDAAAFVNPGDEQPWPVFRDRDRCKTIRRPSAGPEYTVLPGRSLTLWGDGDELTSQFLRLAFDWGRGVVLQFSNETTALFPALRRLDHGVPITEEFYRNMQAASPKIRLHLRTLFASEVRNVCYGHRHLSDDSPLRPSIIAHPKTTTPPSINRIRIYCDCNREGGCVRRRLGALVRNSFLVEAQSIDVKKEWVDQVLQCSITPGFVKGRLPVVLVAWMKDSSDYSPEYTDAVVITDGNGCICLWDYVDRLAPRDVDSGVPFEVYDPVQDKWRTVALRQTLGPIESAGSALLIRRPGVTKMGGFDRFKPMAYSLSASKRFSARDMAQHPRTAPVRTMAKQGSRFLQINGWRNLLLFEKHFSQLHQDEQGIVNLFVGLENVFEAGYPDAPLRAPADDPDDCSYVPSDDESGGCDDEDGESSLDDVGSEVEEDSEDELEYGSPSPSEQLELVDDSAALVYPGVAPPFSLFPDDRDMSGTLEELQAMVNRQSCQAEGHCYAALHRILKASARTLETLALSWQPVNGFLATTLFPVLPQLRSLMVWRDCNEARLRELQRLSCNWWSGVRFELTPEETALFPALKRLEYGGPAMNDRFRAIPPDALKLEYITLPCNLSSYTSDLPSTIKRIRFYCNCHGGRACHRRKHGPPNSFVVDSIDVKREWIAQVTHCSIGPGITKGRIPVVLVAWLKESPQDYSADHVDAVIITDEHGNIHLWNHMHRLQTLEIGSESPLELYDPTQDQWKPLAWREALGPVETPGSALLIRRAGVAKIGDFDCFKSIAYSPSPRQS